MAFDVIPASLAIKAMRDSGYKDTAYAVAELVDNSIQAGATRVEILCTDRIEKLKQRQRKRIEQIAVFDNGSGMNPDTLRLALQFGNGTHLDSNNQDGIGKFGMGLPNSSISQCERLDVWTWQNGKCFYCYLDVEEIRLGIMVEVPEPIEDSPPVKWAELIESEMGESGTFVVWSTLDRVRWKTSKALLNNSSLMVGRMYRYFIHQNTTSIRLAAYCPAASKGWECDFNEYVKPNDPLYLMDGTSIPDLPEPYEKDTLFEEWAEPEYVEVKLPNDESHNVSMKYSIVKAPIRKKLREQFAQPGSSPPGKHAARNIGVSVVRAGRELEINDSFVVGYDPVERWWGVEVSFSPALDDFFGVTNNKQSATAFRQQTLDSDAEAEGMTPQEFMEQLREENDPRSYLYEISQRIDANLRAIRKQLSRHSEGTSKRNFKENPAEEGATRATKFRIDQGYKGHSDGAEESSPEQQKEDLVKGIEDLGVDHNEAKEIADEVIEAGHKYVFQDANYDGPSFFSAASRGGKIIVSLNGGHPASKYLYGLLEGEEDEVSSKALTALKVLLCAWARMEDESQTEIVRQKLSDMRNDWGRIARDFLSITFED